MALSVTPMDAALGAEIDGIDLTRPLGEADRAALRQAMFDHVVLVARGQKLAPEQLIAFGGAVGLVACCDMAIGAHDALFSLSEVRIGLAPAVISPFVVKAMGERAARRYAMTGERFSGERARELGLLSETYAAAELDDAPHGWLDNLMLNSPQAMRASKDLLREASLKVGGRKQELIDRLEKHSLPRVEHDPMHG